MSVPLSTHEQRAARRLGTVLRGKYALERVLGVGGMAAVYLGVHRNGHRVAVKVLHLEASSDPDTRTRFVREGYVANAIGHPGAVRVIDDDVDDDGSAFLVMELLEGETLYARAKRCGGHLPPREVLALAHELCDVLAAAHAKGVVHRDVKPENLFLTTGRVLKVLDFGIARAGEGPGPLATRAGAALGTPAFMPPEQALGRSREVDARSDLFSVGATMFALLSGTLVHEAETGSEMLVAAATRPARSLAAAAPSVPEPIAALVDRALRFSREERWPSATAMREAIEEAHLAAFGEPVSPAAIAPVQTQPGPGTGTGDLFFAATKPATGASLSPVSTTGVGPGLAPDPGAPAGAPSEPTRSEGPSSERPAVRRSEALTLPARSEEGEDAPPETKPSAPLPGSRPRDSGAGARAAPETARGARALAVALAVAIVVALVVRARGPVSAPSLGPAAAKAGCSDNRACVAAAGGRPSICRRSDAVCVPLEAEGCKVLAEPADVADEATVWIGAMFPLSGPDAALDGTASRDAVDLARRDFAETVGGLPPARPGGPRRPLAVVACDDDKDPARVAAHLVDEVRVPVVLGFHRSKEVADLAAAYFTPRGVLALASNTASMLRTIPSAPGQPRLVWRTTIDSDAWTPPVAAFVADIVEPDLRAQPGLLAPGEPIRVALVRVGNASGLGRANAFVSTLRYNGKSVAENGEAFRQIVYSDADDEGRLDEEARRIAAEIVRYRPHLVIGDVTGSRLALAVEQTWPESARFRPRYLDLSLSPTALREHVRRHPEARRRIFNADAVVSTPAMAKFVLRHNEVFPDRVTAATATSAPYDAFYVAAYAIAALGGEPVTGPALARALPRLMPPGEPVDVGPAGIYQALAALESGKSIDLVGTITSLDFDRETGDAAADFAIFCLAPGKDGGLPEPTESGLVFRARTRKLEGSLRCP